MRRSQLEAAEKHLRMQSLEASVGEQFEALAAVQQQRDAEHAKR